MGPYTQDTVERNSMGGVEEVVQVAGDLSAVTIERLFLPKFASSHFEIAVGKTATGDSHGKVRSFAEDLFESELGIDINRRQGHSECEIGPEKFRVVIVIEGIGSQRSFAFQRLVITELD